MGSRRALSATRPRAVRRALRSVATPALAGLLLAAPAAAAAPAHAGWYVGAGAGVNWAFDMDQEGWNRDPVCYPTDACFEAVAAPAIPGYRWRYGVDQDLGTAFELSLGRRFARTRLALSLARHRNDSHQGFRGITYLDGTPREPRDGPVVSEGGAGIGHLRAHTVSLNAYYDFPVAYHRITPYLGGGLGAAFVKVTRLTFDSTYRDTSAAPRAYDPPLAFYAGSQDVSVSDTVFVWALHAGADVALNARTQVGVKLTYAARGTVEDSSGYAQHPAHQWDPGFTNQTRFEDAHALSLMLTVTRWFHD